MDATRILACVSRTSPGCWSQDEGSTRQGPELIISPIARPREVSHDYLAQRDRCRVDRHSS
jgi:hypothetical protein